jgi:ArsR family transcriptional regulator
VKVSKHLAYLRGRGIVATRRRGNWMIYSLPRRLSGELEANLACLQDCTRENPVFQRDRDRLKRLRRRIDTVGPECCPTNPRPAENAHL